jgi:protein SCO1/2
MRITLRSIIITFFISLGLMGLFVWNAGREPVYGGDFTASFRGQDWNFEKEARDLNLLYFGYAKCPDVCPLSLSFLGAAFKKLTPDQIKKIKVIFVSVDYEHDKPEDVADYAQNFYPEFVGLSGTQNQIDTTIGKFEFPKHHLHPSVSLAHPTDLP